MLVPEPETGGPGPGEGGKVRVLARTRAGEREDGRRLRDPSGGGSATHPPPEQPGNQRL